MAVPHSNMWCVIPAAGQGTRLKPLTLNRPKPLLEICGRPIVDWLLQRLAPATSRACIVLRRSDEVTQQTLGDCLHGVKIDYARQPYPLGAADAVASAAGLVDGPFVVAMGDVYYDQPLAPYIGTWRESGMAGAVLVEPVADTDAGEMGLVWLEEDRISRAVKEVFAGQAECRICGLMVLPDAAFEAAREIRSPVAKELELEDVVTHLICCGFDFLALRYSGWRRNINTVEDLEAVEARVRRQESTHCPHGRAGE